MNKKIHITFSIVSIACLAVLLNASVDYWRIVDYNNLTNTFETELVETYDASISSIYYSAIELTDNEEDIEIGISINSNSCYNLFSSFENFYAVQFKKLDLRKLEFDILTHHLIQSSIQSTTLG